MTITSVEEWRKGRFLIYLNDEPAFALYKNEISAYSISEGEELDEDKYRDILDNVLIKRAKSRTLHILDRNDKTEKELRDKLKENMYPAEAIDAAVESAKKGNYLNDRRYACQYVIEKSRTKSRKAIEMDLKMKGIPADLIESAFSESFDDMNEDPGESENALILKLIRKRCPEPGRTDDKTKEKLYRYLTGKGFEFSRCKRILEDYLSSSPSLYE